MSRLSKKDAERITKNETESRQGKARAERAEQVANGSYRPRSATFEDKRRKEQDKMILQEMNDPE